MNRWVIKLLRQHLSVPQMLGFFLANLFGMCIVLVSVQFYVDVLPVFSQGDSFLKPTYVVVGKRVTASQTLRGKSPRFSAGEMADFREQPFVKSLGAFVPAQFDVFATVGSPELGIGLSTDMFFESVPDRYIDADLSRWNYHAGSDSLPIILPRNYLHLYNFGFANTKGLPALSEGLVSLVNLRFRLQGTAGQRIMYGRVVGFSDRLNTILVPQRFLDEANAQLSPDRVPAVSRLMLEVHHPADERLATYLADKGYEEEGGAADAGKAAFFLRMMIGLVLSVGAVICILSFYVLLLSIFLLLQRHTEKIDTLLLLGYTPSSVARPFYGLAFVLNGVALSVALVVVSIVRGYYVTAISQIFPQFTTSTMFPALLLGVSLFLLVALLNHLLIRKKVFDIWNIHRC